MDEPLIFEISRPGRIGVQPDEEALYYSDKDITIPGSLLREGGVLGLPELSEVDVIRHFTRISSWNFHVDANFYPLGSCTMKYNPRINEKIANMESFLYTHPEMPDSELQGVLEVLWQTGEYLKILSGMPHISMIPAAGAQGELAALLMFQAYHRQKGNQCQAMEARSGKKIILIPDSAHGTNPASANLAGFSVKSFKSGEDGLVNMDSFYEAIKAVGEDNVAGAMITNPNTLGLFERDIREISDTLHRLDGLLYIDGANFNAIVGKSDFGKMGADAVHFNLHKTFSTPHGGGGPGSGPVAVSEKLRNFLPLPVIQKESGGSFICQEPIHSIGRLKLYFGNFSVILKALAYLRTLGRDHITKISERAVINANYIKKRLENYLYLPFRGDNLHEVAFSDKEMKKEFGMSAIDLAKALLDRGFHAPTVYFPLIVPGAILIEPTDTESRDTLDSFCDAIIEILDEAKKNPEVIRGAPKLTRFGRLDEVAAARNPILCFDSKI